MTVYRVIRHTSNSNCQVFSFDEHKAQMTWVALNRSSVSSHETHNSSLNLVSSNGVLRPSYFCFKRRCIDISKECYQSLVVAIFPKIGWSDHFIPFRISHIWTSLLMLNNVDPIYHPFNTKSVLSNCISEMLKKFVFIREQNFRFSVFVNQRHDWSMPRVGIVSST